MPSLTSKVDEITPPGSPGAVDAMRPATHAGVTSVDRLAVRPQEPASGSEDADRQLHAMFARLTGGISPVALSLAYFDWAAHLAAAPQRQMEIIKEAMAGISQFARAALHFASPEQGPWSLIKPQPQDRRFAAPE